VFITTMLNQFRTYTILSCLLHTRTNFSRFSLHKDLPLPTRPRSMHCHCDWALGWCTYSGVAWTWKGKKSRALV